MLTMFQTHEIWQYDEWTQYDGKDDSTGLFAGYMNLYLAQKTEASGWPPGVETPEQKEHFITEFLRREGVKLIPANMLRNACRRTSAKRTHFYCFVVCSSLFGSSTAVLLTLLFSCNAFVLFTSNQYSRLVVNSKIF